MPRITSKGNEVAANAAGVDARTQKLLSWLSSRKVKTIGVCVLVIVVFAVIPIFVNTAIGYVPLFTAIFALVLCAVYLRILDRSLSFAERGPDTQCLRGEVLRFELEVSNTAYVPATRIEAEFCIANTFGDGIRSDMRLITLPPRSAKSFDLGVKFDHIGLSAVGIRRINVWDLLGIFSSMKDNGELQQVAIAPRIVPIADLPISDRSLQESQKNIKTFINDGMDYSGIRDYSWGDPIKSIHWKLSAKSMDSYYTRLYETPTAPALGIFLDFESPRYPDEVLMSIYDAVVESALSVENYASEIGYETELLFVDRMGERTRINGPFGHEYAALMARVPQIHEGARQEMLELLEREASTPQCPNNLVICTTNVTSELVNALVSMASPARSPFLMAVAPKGDRDEADAMRKRLRPLDQSSIPYAVIVEAEDLRDGE